MAGYPITLQLENKVVLIIGGGKVAARKAPALLAAGANVTILSPELDDSLTVLKLNWIQAAYQRSILENLRPVLVFAATNQAEINRAVWQDARDYGIFVNVADDAEASDFHNMAVLEKELFTIVISSNAASPALLRLVRERIDKALSAGLLLLAVWLRDIRSQAREQLSRQEERQALYERIIASDVLNLLEAGKDDEAKVLFDTIIKEAL